MITAEEVDSINRRIRELARTDAAVHYGLAEVPTKRAAVIEIVRRIPNREPVHQAAWLMRAIILVQPFPDANHRTALLSAELLLERSGVRFDPTTRDAERFQREVSGARYRLLGGYDDAPLSVLDNPEDPVFELCRGIVERCSSAEGAQD